MLRQQVGFLKDRYKASVLFLCYLELVESQQFGLRRLFWTGIPKVGDLCWPPIYTLLPKSYECLKWP